MKILWLALGLTALSTPAWGQAVTYADLDGALVEATVMYQTEGRKNGERFSSRSQVDWKIVVGPGSAGFSTAITTNHGPRGPRVSAPRSGSFTLGQPGPIKYLGGGQRLWTFKDGVLTFLRTFKAGAFKLDIAFAREAGVLSCTANTTLAREDGVGAIRMDSHFGDGDVEITNQKQISSSCRVTKRE